MSAVVDSYKAQVDINITLKDAVDSIAPDDVGNALKDLADLLDVLNTSDLLYSIFSGTVAPVASNGASGDLYYQTDGGNLRVHQKRGTAWQESAVVAFGVDGTLLYGTVTPVVGVGKNGDSYLNTTAGTFYEKSGGTWTLKYTVIANSNSSSIAVMDFSATTTLTVLNWQTTYPNKNNPIFQVLITDPDDVNSHISVDGVQKKYVRDVSGNLTQVTIEVSPFPVNGRLLINL